MLASARRIIVKVGSALLVDDDHGRFRQAWLEALVDDLAALHDGGRRDVLVVTSGAISLGRGLLGLRDRTIALADKQAAAAVGQIELSHLWRRALGRHGLPMAQVLLTLEDTDARQRYLNARATLQALLGHGAVPVINENDTVASDEIRVGDNDRLAAKVAQMIDADVLVLLSDVDGLYTADPRRDPAARRLEEVRALDPEILAMAGQAPKGYSSGGMVTKLEAARIAMAAGCEMVIALGTGYHPLQALLDGAPCTRFVPAETPLSARRHWIVTALAPRGVIRCDAGAILALRAGRNLLPAGVSGVEGDFAVGDAVRVLDAEGQEVARGLASYSAPEAGRLVGAKSQHIERVLGYSRGNALLHSDDLVVLDELDHGGDGG